MSQTGKQPKELVQDLWHKHGRVFTLLCNYDISNKKTAENVIVNLKEKLPKLIGVPVKNKKITDAFVFSYTDPVTGEITENQGICICFGQMTRLIFRLSGTSSVGATLKLYINERITDEKKFDNDPLTVLSNWVKIASEISELKRLTGVQRPSMIT